MHLAKKHKKYVGNMCYKTAAATNFVLSEGETCTIILEMPDGKIIEIPDEYSMLMLINNGRFGGTGIYFTPCAIINDGLLDLIFHHGPA